jgi:hypothetical protein
MGRRWKQIAGAGALIAMLAAAPAAYADGTEQLGPPSIAIASGTDALVAGVGTQQYPDTPVSFAVNVPAGATVKQVIAYWQGQITSESPPDHPDDEISLNGKPVTGSWVSSPTNPYFGELFFTFRADVTALNLVGAGANTVTVSNMNFVSDRYHPSGNKGVGLAVIYSDGSGSTFDELKDGQDYAWAGFGAPHNTTVPQTFEFASTTRDRAATLSLMVGDGLDYTEAGVPGSVISGRFDTGQTFSIVNQLLSKQGPEFDADNLPITVPAGAKSLTVQILSEGGDQPASIVWVGAALTVDNDVPPEEPEPCKPAWGKIKWLIWVSWWKRWVGKEYGDRAVAKYDRYWGGEDCKPDGDDCDRAAGFWFGRHWGECRPTRPNYIDWWKWFLRRH